MLKLRLINTKFEINHIEMFFFHLKGPSGQGLSAGVVNLSQECPGEIKQFPISQRLFLQSSTQTMYEES